jgi:antitoxin HicB
MLSKAVSPPLFHRSAGLVGIKLIGCRIKSDTVIGGLPVKIAKTRNKHRGSSLRSFLKEDGVLQEVEAAALKRALALEVADLMEKGDFNKSTLAAEMRTSRAAINRILDPNNTSVTLTTLNKVARSLGRKLKIELVPA